MQYPITRRSMMTGAAVGCVGLAAFGPEALAQAAGSGAASAGQVFPFPVHRRDLPTGCGCS
jgi:hypothetical protein